MNNFIYKKGNDGFIITGLKNTSLKKLVIPEGVVRIEKDALSETNIESVWFPKSIKSIGDYAFGLCESLITVVFDDDCDLEEIEEYAFANCFNLKNINFPSSLISIGYNAFYSCASLEKVTIPTSVVKMGANVFEDCSELEQIVLQHSSVPTSFHIYWNSDQTDVILNGKTSGFSSKPVVEKKKDIVIKPYSKSNLATKKSITTSSPSVSSKTIEKETIKPKSNLDDFIIGENYKWETGIKIARLKDPSKPVGTLYIPEEVTSIADNAFFQNPTIKKVVGHPNFKYIGSRAFAFCSEITEVVLDRKTGISDQAFKCCRSLNHAHLTSNVYEEAFSQSGITSVTIDDDVDTIRERMFYGCNNLKEVVIPNSVTYISNNAFGWCHSLSKVTFGENVAYIMNSAFAFCSSLTHLELPKQLLFLEKSAFSDCRNLKTLIINKRLHHIPSFAFSNCDSLEKIRIPVNISRIDEYAFSSRDLKEVIIEKRADDPVGIPKGWHKNWLSRYENQKIMITYVNVK